MKRVRAGCLQLFKTKEYRTVAVDVAASLQTMELRLTNGGRLENERKVTVNEYSI
jgi:hypothetical protein